MHPQSKHIALEPSSFTAAATASLVIDRLGFDHAVIDVDRSRGDVVSNKPSVLRVLESDITDTTGYATFTGAVAGTDFTLPSETTNAVNRTRLAIDCKARKRYLKVEVSPRTTQVLSISANLFRGKIEPDTATLAGVDSLVNIA